MELLAYIHRLLERLSLWAVWAGGTALLLSAVMVTIDVLSRKYLNVTMSGSDEITGYVFAGATTWAYAYCLLHRSNIRIDALYNLLPLFLRATLDIVGLLALLIFIGFLSSKAVTVFTESWVNDSVSVTTLTTPLWIPQLVWLAGLIFFNVTLIFVLLYTACSFVVRGPASVQRLAGTRSVQEEITEETHSLTEPER
ncbi:MAG: TRAP transporter small permease [Rhodospirillales bacterium]|nr:TRAP transporter small permease [Rhodospirillales bacterium]MDE0374242.1 TRAP transporter small permease [Rhodospirillales bacterium]MYE20722.1 TRAP transporter small permease [Rhodospirillales bacterium]